MLFWSAWFIGCLWGLCWCYLRDRRGVSHGRGKLPAHSCEAFLAWCVFWWVPCLWEIECVSQVGLRGILLWFPQPRNPGLWDGTERLPWPDQSLQWSPYCCFLFLVIWIGNRLLLTLPPAIWSVASGQASHCELISQEFKGHLWFFHLSCQFNSPAVQMCPDLTNPCITKYPFPVQALSLPGKLQFILRDQPKCPGLWSVIPKAIR